MRELTPGKNCSPIPGAEDKCGCGCDAYGSFCGDPLCWDFHFSPPDKKPQNSQDISCPTTN